MVKIVITDKHILVIIFVISISSLILGLYNTYQVYSIASSISIYNSLSTINLPLLSVLNPVYGNSSSILIFEYLDYLCPYCAKFEVETFQKLKEKYVDRGRVSYVVKNFIVHGQDAVNLALYASCIYSNNGLSEYQDFKEKIYKALYDSIFVKRNYTEFQSSLENMLSDYNIEGCLNDGSFVNLTMQVLSIDANEAIVYNLEGTPGFVILIRKDLLPEDKLREVKRLLDSYKNRGMSYSIWLSSDRNYVVISFAGAMSFDFFDKFLSAI